MATNFMHLGWQLDVLSMRAATHTPSKGLPDSGSFEIYPYHRNIVTTVFWVGEPADNSNGYVGNSASAWDDSWQRHFGGLDSPVQRTAFRPIAFVPGENTFYTALPYSDVNENGDRKPTATRCPQFYYHASQPFSWCKNSWIAISHADKTVYAQWEDSGPFESDDTAYVFGTSQPRNHFGERAGLDVSPAVRDYLSLQDVDHTDWRFMAADSIPNGPWHSVVTIFPGTQVN